jgi:hypothetical protein
MMALEDLVFALLQALLARVVIDLAQSRFSLN